MKNWVYDVSELNLKNHVYHVAREYAKGIEVNELCRRWQISMEKLETWKEREDFKYYMETYDMFDIDYAPMHLNKEEMEQYRKEAYGHR